MRRTLILEASKEVRAKHQYCNKSNIHIGLYIAKVMTVPVRLISEFIPVVIRGCETIGLGDTCIDVSIATIDVKECYCYTDLCNRSPSFAPAGSIVLLISVAVFLLKL